MMKSSLASSVAIIRALGHPARLRTIAMLRSGELCVCQITEILELATSTVSLHLKELKRAGLISERKVGRWVYLSLSEADSIKPWIHTALEAIGDDPQLQADAAKIVSLLRVAVEDLCRLGYEGAQAKANREQGLATAVPTPGVNP